MAIDFKKFIKGIVLGNDVDPSKKLQVEVTSSATTATKTTVQASQTANRTIILPDASTTLVGGATTDTLTNKTIDADLNTITNIENADIKSGAAIDAAKIANGSVSNTEYQYLDGVTSSIQTQLNQGNTNLTDHLNDAVDAHDASAISNIPSGNLAATDQQSANNELQSDIDLRLLKAGDTMSGTLNMGSNLITSLATPVSGTDAANKNYVDGISAGLDPKESVRVATTASVGGSYANTPSNGQFTGAATSVDGVTLSVNDRVLIKDQTDQKQNGIYVYTASGQFTRSADMDGTPASEVSGGNFCFVVQGTTNSASGYVLVANGTLTLNTDNLVFTQFSGGANSANKTLSNLDSPTAINQSLIPTANNTQDLGSTTRAYQDLYTGAIRTSAGVPVLLVGNRQLIDAAGNPAFTYSSATELNANSRKITTLANPAALTDAVNKQSAQELLKNMIADGDAEGSNVFTAYADAAASRPVDGTGGSPAVTATISATAPLAGLNSFVFTKDAANRQGQGIAAPFTINNANKAKVIQIEFDYIVGSGTFVAGSPTADSDVIVYIYDVTNSTLIEPSSIKLLSNSSTIADKFVSNFQTSATGTSYRLILHCATTSASAYTLKIDSVKVSSCDYVYGTPIKDWQTYIPTYTGFGTVATTSVQWRQVGDSVEIRGRFTAGTPTAVEARVSLPNGYVIDNTKLTITSIVGNWARNLADTSSVSYYVLGQPNVAYFNIGRQTATDTPLALANGNGVSDTTGSASFYALLPISGLSSSVQMSDSYDGRQIGFRANNSSTTINSTPAKIIWTNTDKDDVAAYSSGTYTVRSAGWYDVAASLYVSGTPSVDQTSQIYIYRNSAAIKTFTHRYKVASATTTSIGPVADSFYFNSGDTVEIYASSEITTPAISSSTTLNTVFIGKRQSPTTISATEVVAAIYGLTTAQAVSTNAVLKYDTKIQDTHNAYSTSTGLFTAPVPGTYRFTITVLTSAAANMYIKVNGANQGVLLTASTSVTLNGSTEYPLNAGDTVGIYNNNGGTFNATDGTLGYLNKLSISRIK